MFPNNDIDTVELPKDSWSQEKRMVEFRQNLTRASLVEVQIDSLKLDGHLSVLCCDSSSEDFTSQIKVKGHRGT